MAKGKWNIAEVAVRQYMVLRNDPETQAAFDNAAAELQRLSELAVFKREFAGGRFEWWRVKATVDGCRRRLDLRADIEHRAEGVLDQLVSVKDADRRG